MRSREVLKLGENLLKEFDGDDARIVAGILLEHVTGIEAFRHYSDEMEIEPEEREEFIHLILRRLSGEPVQYIIGWVGFMGLEISVEEGVFIPRPETEELVEIALREIKNIKNPVVFDIGTGSGAIGLAIAHFRDDAVVFMTDVSERACEVARYNAEKLGMEDKVKILNGDLFSPLSIVEPADLIVSNPPYIPEGLIPGLPEDVRREPEIALDGGEYGTDIINRILDEAWLYLKKRGNVLIEIDSVNLDYIKFPDRVKYRYLKDAYGNTRFLKAWRSE